MVCSTHDFNLPGLKDNHFSSGSQWGFLEPSLRLRTPSLPEPQPVLWWPARSGSRPGWWQRPGEQAPLHPASGELGRLLDILLIWFCYSGLRMKMRPGKMFLRFSAILIILMKLPQMAILSLRQRMLMSMLTLIMRRNLSNSCMNHLQVWRNCT